MQLNERNQTLKAFAVTEATLKQMKNLGHAEATWRNNHELKVQIQWAHERHAFIQAELDQLLPPKNKPPAPKDTPPLQSHRTGRARTGGTLSTYGEKFG